MRVNQTSFGGQSMRGASDAALGICRLASAVVIVLAFAHGAALAQIQAQIERPSTATPNAAKSGQTAPKPVAEPGPQAVPGFWDPRRRPDRPDLSRLTVIRFLTETDYPPFNFTGPDGNPAGFNVDLARMICDEIKVTCTV
jgi:polar amino acid transport system substrate-binding protein